MGTGTVRFKENCVAPALLPVLGILFVEAAAGKSACAAQVWMANFVQTVPLPENVKH
jgi:hypothetical protein